MIEPPTLRRFVVCMMNLSWSELYKSITPIV
ncbi:hypothetical protein THIARS_40200 [Thiomonas delicata]|uniref:Uncharacterized protein n=1 Tax=Thiomonas delicata TaxID=364030 RepID=A0A238CZZ2_THIDL|nr:hypothetical protein THIARS_40200 [Thiomonas delicata]